MKPHSGRSFVSPRLEVLEGREVPATLTVTNTLDAGLGSLRQAIMDANANPGLDTIAFNITGAGVHTISPVLLLPEITDPVVIDGFTQPGSSPNNSLNGNNAVLQIELSGNLCVQDGSGLHITGGNSTVRGLVINRFQSLFGIGIELSGGGGNVVAGNFIGTDATGTVDQGNDTGILIRGGSGNTVGGTAAADHNLISGHGSGNGGGIGIDILQNAPGNVIQGNLIGTDASGTVALVGAYPESESGVVIESANNVIGGATPGARNVIAGHSGIGLEIDGGTGQVIQGNYIGTNAAGTAAMSNFHGVQLNSDANLFGGSAPGAGNLISGNQGWGVSTSRSGNVLQGNLIGTDATGTLALGNGTPGLYGEGVLISGSNNTIGGTTAGARNVISGNYGPGISFGISGSSTSGNLVQGNFIGTDATGKGALGNTGDGVLFVSGQQPTQTCSNNTIGGTQAGAGNTIAFNGGAGVALDDSWFGPAFGTKNAILHNSIFSNGGLGIDLGNDGVTANDLGDGDAGQNNLQNFPVLTVVNAAAGRTTIHGSLNSTPNTTFTVEFFASAVADPSGYGEGERYLGSGAVTTNAAGNANFKFTFQTTVPSGQFISATATDPAGNTSEFSLARQVGRSSMSVSNTSTREGNNGMTGFIFTVTLSNPSAVPVTVNCATADGSARAGQDYQATSGTLTFAPGETVKTVVVWVYTDAMKEQDENFFLDLSGAVNADLTNSRGMATILNDD